MHGCTLSVDLIRTARNAVEKVARNAASGGPAVHAMLLASQLFEALKLELRATPRQEAAKIGLLAAAIDQCRRTARPNMRPALVEAELRATLALLESGASIRLVANGSMPGPSASRPRLRVIEGGLSARG